MDEGSRGIALKGRTARAVAVGIVVAVIAALGGYLYVVRQEPFYATPNGFVLDSTTPHGIPLPEVSTHSTRDGTPAIDEPAFVPIADADYREDQKGVLIDLGGEQRFYPYAILAWHEVLNDNFGDKAVVLFFRPSDEASAVFDREADDERIRFGNSGLRYDTQSLFYDIDSQSLWLGLTGRAVVGTLAGTQLQQVDTAYTLDIASAKERYPLAVALSTDTGFTRDYRINPFKEN